MGVSVYPKKRSPFWYVSFDSPDRARRVSRATPFRRDDPAGEQKAFFFAQEKSAGAAILRRASSHEAFDVWVLPWIERHFAKRPRTRARYRGAWKFLGHYLRAIAKVDVPRGLAYKHAIGYHEWRITTKKRNGEQVGTNTALCDLKIMSGIMSEAVRRDFASANPCLRLGIAKDKVRHARRLTPAELALIERKLSEWIAEPPEKRAWNAKDDREWMLIAYTIARYQGCRLRETRLHLTRQINLAENRVTFIAKGRDGKPHEFPTFLHAKVRPLIERLIAEGRTYTIEMPVAASVPWRRFFDWIGLRDAWFHCLRATVATELALGGVPISLAMRFMGHAKEEVHRAYQDIKAAELSVCAEAIGQTSA